MTDSIDQKKNYRILLAEDDQTNRFVTVAVLQKNGFDVICAANGIEACEALNNSSFDLILMDISMPKMDGFEATKKIRGLPDARAKLPIIALTALNLSEDRENCLNAGMDDYLSKPVKGSDLVSKINNWLQNAKEPLPNEELCPEHGEDNYLILDETVLERLAFDTDTDILPSLIQTFLEVTKNRIANITNALKTSNLDSLEFETHALGSSAATFGAMELHHLARNVELTCASGELELAIELAQRIPALAKTSSQRISQYLVRQNFNALEACH